MPIVNMHCHSFTPVLMPYVPLTEIKARLMAASQGNSEIKIVEALEQLVQENQALKVEVGAMRVQMAEMMSIMQTLKNGIIAKATATESPGGIATIVLSPRPDALPIPGFGIKHLAPEISNQNYPATQTPSSVIMPRKSPIGLIPPPTTALQVQNRNPRNLPQALHCSTQARKSHKTSKYRQFDPIPMPYSDLFNHLLSNNLITTRSMKPLQPPFPRSYNTNAACEFHKGGVGHTLEDCKAFKHAVQDLIESNWLSFDDSSASGVHAEKRANANAMINQGKLPQYDPSPMSYADLCSFLISHGVISPRKMEPIKLPFPKEYNPEATCVFHAGAIGHSTEVCNTFKQVVWDLVDSTQLTLGSGIVGLSVKGERPGAEVIKPE